MYRIVSEHCHAIIYKEGCVRERPQHEALHANRGSYLIPGLIWQAEPCREDEISNERLVPATEDLLL